MLAAAVGPVAGSASAELKEVVMRHGPFGVGPYSVRYTDPKSKIVEAPDADGFIVRMHAQVVDAGGRRLPVRRMMLHHVLYKNRGRFDGDRRDPVCGGGGQSFYGTGEEDQTLRFPPGYGYRIRRGDRWTTAWMLMNHRHVPDSAYIEYRMTIDDSPGLTPVTPYWLRVTGCPRPGLIDPIFNVPGGRRRGSTAAKAISWRMPAGGRLIAAGGHAHGGSKNLTIAQPRCGNRALLRSRPLYGRADHPYYHVLPVLHEPGPVDMSWNQTAAGIPLGRGERLRLTSYYDGELPHTRVMGIMHLYVAHQPGTRASCAPLPADLTNERLGYRGRTTPPRVRVPLTGIGRDGRARRISRPPGRTKRLEGRAVTIRVRNFRFSLRNLSVPLGALVRWRFADRAAHNVTVASGPYGFASQNHGRGATARQRLTRAGRYRLFCSLHPVQMTETIVVRRGSRAGVR